MAGNRTKYHNLSHMSKHRAIDLLKKHTLQQIAQIYGTSIQTVQSKIDSLFVEKVPDKIEVKETKVGACFDGVLIFKTVGAWMESQERKSYLQTKKMLKNEKMD